MAQTPRLDAMTTLLISHQTHQDVVSSLVLRAALLAGADFGVRNPDLVGVIDQCQTMTLRFSKERIRELGKIFRVEFSDDPDDSHITLTVMRRDPT